MKSSAGEPFVEVLRAESTDRGFRVVCKFSEPHREPIAPGALYDKPKLGEERFPLHRVSKRDGLTITFETFSPGLSVPPPPVGKSFFYRGWWTQAAMNAALDRHGDWKRIAYPNDGTHEHCLFLWETISSYTGERIGYYSSKHGWITERAYTDFIVRDVYHLREET